MREWKTLRAVQLSVEFLFGKFYFLSQGDDFFSLELLKKGLVDVEELGELENIDLGVAEENDELVDVEPQVGMCDTGF